MKGSREKQRTIQSKRLKKDNENLFGSQKSTNCVWPISRLVVANEDTVTDAVVCRYDFNSKIVSKSVGYMKG
uniref:SFRICE_017861 n=1 Tax=Spodoptera frugiperda TaxID=7108 RepID=A0A2H1WTH3_SPOFR